MFEYYANVCSTLKQTFGLCMCVKRIGKSCTHHPLSIQINKVAMFEYITYFLKECPSCFMLKNHHMFVVFVCMFVCMYTAIRNVSH